MTYCAPWHQSCQNVTDVFFLFILIDSLCQHDRSLPVVGHMNGCQGLKWFPGSWGIVISPSIHSKCVSKQML